MIKLKRTDYTDPDFTALVTLLDADLSVRDGKDQDFYKQFNRIDNINHVVIAYKNEIPIGCGAFKYFEEGSVEIKRMFVKEENRGTGVGRLILKELESWAKETGFGKTVLETGKKQPEAIRMYQKNHYIQIPNYGQYVGIDNSICMSKTI